MKIWTCKKLNLSHIHVWGCPAYVLKKSSNKLDTNSKLCWFIGYPKGTRRYYFYSESDKVFVSTNAKFMKEESS